ncbi:Carboxylesterase [Hyphodiscus hymeniophilus]|uniref:Carboxylesterase n=1 Tax=Hyphodiscus hymeniophilus TaxID=353542 RepID=A0A9P6VRM4_9HELO|nr:Carboxylesterase [Hyphodiscus hymeniophilus]
MADESPSVKRSTSPAITPIRRSFTVDESAQSRHRPQTNRVSVSNDTPSPKAARRRSSNFSEYSLNEARRTFQSSTDDLLLPKPSATGIESSHDSSVWHSAPLAFALLPAIGGMLFQNGSSVITDVMLLGLAAIFLNWSVRLPWDWYHSAQSIRNKEEYNGDIMVEEESEDDVLSFSQATMEEVPEEEAPKPSPKPIRRLPAHESATNELYTHEVLALLSCFIFPLLGAYLLHTIRSQLSRPSEGLVSNYNLTIFLLASELRPMAHLVKLIQSRTLHLQRVVNANPYDTVNGKDTGEIKDLVRRLEDLETRSSTAEPSPATSSEPALNGKQSAVLTTEVRRTMQPDLDALNRAVRRYEKRATLQAFQTESRLLDLEAKLNDAISLAAAAANNSHRQRGFTAIIVEWVATAIVLPLQAFAALASLPFKTIITLINFGKTSVTASQSVFLSMALTSDITVDITKFDPATVSEQTAKLNQHIINVFEPVPKWYEVGAAKYRQMRLSGETPLPAPKLLPEALDINLPSRESGRDIICRLVYPPSRKTPEERQKCRGTVLHIHGGGWVLGDHASHDNLLQLYANAGDLAVISVGYRLAPEDPFPKGPQDCIDVAEYLVQNSEKEYGGPLKFIGGESAGAHLSLVTTFYLLKAHPALKLSGLLLHFGCYDMTLLPNSRNYRKTLVLDRKIMEEFIKSFLPGKSLEEMKDPSISPYYEDLTPFRGKLPTALFTCGTDDPLLDDSVNMAIKWMVSGGEAIIKIYPGACHGFIGFPPDQLEEAGKALEDTKTFIKQCMA